MSDKSSIDSSSNQKRWLFAGRRKKRAAKKKPASVKAFFPTLKNSQGFPLHLCRYEPSVGDHVYVPKSYGQISMGTRGRKFCPHCMLQPCLTLEHLDEIQDSQFDYHWAHDKAAQAGRKVRKLTPVSRAERCMVQLAAKYFGKEHMKRVGVPQCCINEAHQYNVEWTKRKEEEAEAEAEEIAQVSEDNKRQLVEDSSDEENEFE